MPAPKSIRWQARTLDHRSPITNFRTAPAQTLSTNSNNRRRSAFQLPAIIASSISLNAEDFHPYKGLITILTPERLVKERQQELDRQPELSRDRGIEWGRALGRGGAALRDAPRSFKPHSSCCR